MDEFAAEVAQAWRSVAALIDWFAVRLRDWTPAGPRPPRGAAAVVAGGEGCVVGSGASRSWSAPSGVVTVGVGVGPGSAWVWGVGAALGVGLGVALGDGVGLDDGDGDGVGLDDGEGLWIGDGDGLGDDVGLFEGTA